MSEQLNWTRSSFCDSSACAEVLVLEDGVLMRNSRTRLATTYTREEWEAFILGAKDGQFDFKPKPNDQ